MARRKRVQPQAKYDAAGNGRRIKSWSPPSSGPNRAIQGLQKIRDRARDVSRNDWAGESGLQKWTTALIGTGIVPRWQDDAITERYKQWVPKADADGVLDFYGLETLATRSWLDGGEVFARRRPRALGTALPAPLQVQLIEPEFCPVFDADQWPGMPQGNTIRQGIERNKRGERIAYWMYREHPGDGFLTAPTTDSLIRVPARDIIHVFEPKRAGQLRGVSQIAPVLVRLRASMDFEDAVLDRQKLANLFTMFITRKVPEAADIDYDPLTGLPIYYGADDKPMAGLEPGMSQTLLPGEDVKFANPPEAGTTFSDYMRTTHLGTSAGLGLPHELFTGDLKDISDRTLRVVINEFRRFAQQRQWQILIPQFCQRVIEWWADADVLGGGLPLSKLDAAKAPKWSPQGWEYIHPTQDAEGKKIEVEAGFRSRSDVIAERGDDPREVDDERAADLKRSKSLGLEPPPPPPPAPKPAPTKAELEMTDLRLRRERAEVQALESPPPPVGPSAFELSFVAWTEQSQAQTRELIAHVAALAAREAPAPVINNHLPASVVENIVNVEPTPIENVVQAAAPTVEVNVEAPVVNVTPELHMPDRETVSTPTYDAAGRLIGLVRQDRTLND